jgi:hypothetical protein
VARLRTSIIKETDMIGRGKISDGHADPRPLRGVERRREIRAEDSIETKRIADHLLDTLRRPPTVAEELKAELIGRTACKIRRLAEQGRDSLAERQLLEDLLRVPFNAPASTIGHVVTKGGDPAPDGSAPVSPHWPAPPMAEQPTD